MLHALLERLGTAALGRFMRRVAEGGYGHGWQKAYLAAQGYKTWTGLVLLAICGGLAALHQDETVATIGGTFSALLIAAGLLDRLWREKPPAMASLAWYKWCQTHGADLSWIAGTLGAAFTTCDPQVAALLAHAYLTCQTGLMALGFSVGAALAIGIDVKIAPPPALPPSAGPKG